jgi:hypothetical protein
MAKNSEQHLIGLLLGHQVAIKYVSGPDLTEDNVDRVVQEGQVLKGQPETRTATFYLRAYSDFGIEVTERAERGNEIFMPWSAVLAIWEPPREDLERNSWEAVERSERTEESGLPQDRQELMNLLGSARTPSEIANARAAADSWLATHPGDGDVRLAREKLESAYPAEDLEEGSPT